MIPTLLMALILAIPALLALAALKAVSEPEPARIAVRRRRG
ncbi:hypothetical protein ACUN0C_01260 [Faunimonas sp. B44]